MKELDLTLMAYADGELLPDQAAHVEAMIAAQPALRQIVNEHRETTALLRQACSEQFYAQGGLTFLRPRPAPRRRTFAGWAVAATVAGILGFGAGHLWPFGNEASARDRLVSEIAEYHDVFSRETAHLVEIPASRADELKDWLSERIGRNIGIADLTGMGLHFAGGRMLVVDGRPVAELMYTRDGGRPIALCITEAQRPIPSDSGTVRIDRKGDLSLASWYQGQHAFVVVGNADETLLRDIARQTQVIGAG